MGPPAPKPLHAQKISLYFQRVPGLKICGMKYHNVPQPAHSSALILGNPSHTLYPVLVQRHKERDKDSLWLSVTAATMNSRKILRSKCVRRIREAFYEAMNDRGLRRDGRTLAEGHPFLRGSLELFAQKPLLFVNHETVKTQMCLAVDKLVEWRKDQAKFRYTD